jgi:hypothetical protein
VRALSEGQSNWRALGNAQRIRVSKGVAEVEFRKDWRPRMSRNQRICLGMKEGIQIPVGAVGVGWLSISPEQLPHYSTSLGDLTAILAVDGRRLVFHPFT